MLPCGHIFFYLELDNHFGLASLYRDSEMVRKSSSSGFSGTFMPAPCCPTCSVATFKVNRYKSLCSLSTINASTAKILSELDGDLIRYRDKIRNPRDIKENLQLLGPIVQASYTQARLVDLWKQAKSMSVQQCEIIQYPIQDDLLLAVRTWTGFAECQIAIMRCRGLYLRFIVQVSIDIFNIFHSC